MMFEMRNFVGENTDIIEIVSSDSAMGALKRAGIKNIRVCLPLLLSFGDLLDLNNYSRDSLEELYNIDGYKPFNEGFNFELEMDLLKESVKKAKIIRVWSSHLSCDEYCLLLYICSLFKDKEIHVIFAEELNWNCLTVGMTGPKEVEELLHREHILKKHEIDEYIEEWNKIVLENSSLRHIVNGEVIGVDINFFDKKILSYLRDLKEIRINAFIGILSANYVINDADYALYYYLIKRLIKDNKIDMKLVDNINYISLK